MSFMLDLEEVYESLWPIVQDTDGIERVSIDVDYGGREVHVQVYLEGQDNYYGKRPRVHATVGWKARTSTLMKKIKAGIKLHVKNHDQKVKAAEAEVTRLKARVKDAEAAAKVVSKREESIRMLVPTPLEELAQQAE